MVRINDTWLTSDYDEASLESDEYFTRIQCEINGIMTPQLHNLIKAKGVLRK